MFIFKLKRKLPLTRPAHHDDLPTGPIEPPGSFFLKCLPLTKFSNLL